MINYIFFLNELDYFFYFQSTVEVYRDKMMKLCQKLVEKNFWIELLLIHRLLLEFGSNFLLQCLQIKRKPHLVLIS